MSRPICSESPTIMREPNEVIRCPTRKAKRVKLAWEFNHLECSSSVVDPCLVSRAQRSICQLTSLLGLVWVPWPILPQHSSFGDFMLYWWQGGAFSTPTKPLHSGFDAQLRSKSACRCVASKWTLRQNSRVSLQQACLWVVEARSESKGSKALHDDSGCIYPSRPCSQVELPQCGCSRKLVWISRSVASDWMSNFKVDKSPRQVAASVQWSKVFKHQLT